MLLHDDGTHLWDVPLSGRPRVLWTHPRVDVYQIAAAPDGIELAYSVGLPGGRGSVLYELMPDGRIRAVATASDGTSMVSPVFVRPPTDPTGPLRLYWVARASTALDPATQTPRLSVMTLGPRAPEPVVVPLRWGEAPFELSAYPGTPAIALMVFRRDNIPTRLEVLREDDLYAGARESSPTVWGYWQSVANTDVEAGVAWVSPTTYVAGVGQQDTLPVYSLKEFRYGCEFFGSHPVYTGSRLDLSTSDVLWPLLPFGSHTVLAIGRAAAAAAAASGATGGPVRAPWLAIDLRTGSIRVTGADWDGNGAWTTVQPAVRFPLGATPECGGVRWTYP